MTADPNDHLPLPTAAFYILLALGDQDRHGYSIMLDITSRSQGAFSIGPATLYTTIKRLLADGMIEELDERADVESDKRRRYYRLSRFGRRVAEAELARLQSLVRHARTSLAKG